MENSKENGGVFVPSSLVNNDPRISAIDDADLKIDTVDGKDQLHGTAIAVYQKVTAESNKGTNFSSLVITVPSH